MATEQQQPMALAEGSSSSSAAVPAGVAVSARTSLKRARILFDTTSRQSTSNTTAAATAAAKRALVPPVDRSLHKASVARRVRSNYPVIPSDVNAAGDEEGGGAGSGSGAKSKGGSTSLTAQVLGELRQETARRIVRGKAAGTDAGGGAGVAGQIVLHREVDLGIAGGAAAPAGGAAALAAGAGGAGVLALPGQKVQDVGGAKDGGDDASGTVRPGGILVVSLDIRICIWGGISDAIPLVLQF